MAKHCGASLRSESKFFGLTAKVNFKGHNLHLLIPTTFMNRSGQAVGAMAQFYKIPPAGILVAHDELDLPPGTARFKFGGGHGGHNGLRDTIAALGNSKDFHRLRIGIGHPGHASAVTGFVLKAAPAKERGQIADCIDEAISALPLLLDGDAGKAMTQLHSFSA
ncbi:MAG: aminoacyl-tRNA hydrolase [Gammaproteobacteria bacterium]|nr:MAG: aminoacyl-tRNA hydrolase [Gammaproteobacteria bacterium]